jgi:hypothetical protein
VQLRSLWYRHLQVQHILCSVDTSRSSKCSCSLDTVCPDAAKACNVARPGATKDPVVQTRQGAAQAPVNVQEKHRLLLSRSRNIQVQLRPLWCRHLQEQYSTGSCCPDKSRCSSGSCGVNRARCSTGFCSVDTSRRSLGPYGVGTFKCSAGLCSADTSRCIPVSRFFVV